MIVINDQRPRLFMDPLILGAQDEIHSVLSMQIFTLESTVIQINLLLRTLSTRMAKVIIKCQYLNYVYCRKISTYSGPTTKVSLPLEPSGLRNFFL